MLKDSKVEVWQRKRKEGIGWGETDGGVLMVIQRERAGETDCKSNGALCVVRFGAVANDVQHATPHSF